MSGVTIPENAVGHVGMVASLKRLGPSMEGKLVVVREPAGYVTELVGSPKPVFAWLVQSLGELVDCHGKASRMIYVDDACLVPVTDIPAASLERLVRDQSQADFDELLQYAKAALDAQDLSDTDLERLLEKAANQSLIAHALEVVSVETALREMGFRNDKTGLDGLHWAGIHEGTELRISAIPQWMFNWSLQAYGVSSRELICDETVIPNEMPRGQIIQAVLKLWRGAFGRDMVPDCMQLGLLYEQHQAEMRILNPGLPSLRVEPKVFRQILKWLGLHDSSLWNTDELIKFSFQDHMLRIGTDDFAYGCPAQGHWTVACSTRHSDLRGVVASLTHAHEIRIERDESFIYFNGIAVSLSNTERKD